MRVALGNDEPLQADVGTTVTDVDFPDEWSVEQIEHALMDGDGLLNHHYMRGSQADIPWVAAEDPAIAEAIAAIVGGDTEVRPYNSGSVS